MYYLFENIGNVEVSPRFIVQMEHGDYVLRNITSTTKEREHEIKEDKIK